MKTKQTFKWLLAILCITLIYCSAFSQSCDENINSCIDDPDNPYQPISFAQIEDPLILCGDAVLVSVNFQQLGPAGLQYNCPFQVCLNPDGNSDILFDGLPQNSPYSTNAPIGSSGMITFEHVNIPLPGQVPQTLSFYIIANCELWDNLSSGALLNNIIELNTCIQESEQLRCIRVESEPFDILYSQIRLGEGNNINGVEVNEEFELSIPMEISGTNCNPNTQSEIGISIVFDQDIDLSLATVCVDFLDPAYQGVTFVPVINGNTLDLSIHPEDFGGVEAFCSDTFSEGMGEAVLTIKKLVICRCPDPIMRVDYSVDNCTNPPANCTPVGCISTASSYLFMNNGDPALEMTWEMLSGGLDFCQGNDSPTTVRFTITNNSADFATDIGAQIVFPTFVQVLRFRVGDFVDPVDPFWYNNDFQGAHNFNSLHNQAFDCLILDENNLAFNGIDFNFICNDNNIPPLGLDNPDCNSTFADLASGNQFFIELEIEAVCPNISLDACGPPGEPPLPGISGAVRWNNECHSLGEDQLMTSGLINPGETVNIGGPAPQFNFECGDSPDVDVNGEITLNFCYPAWNFDGLAPPLFEQTADNIKQELTITYGSSADFELIQIDLNGTTITNDPPFPQPVGHYTTDISSYNIPPTQERCFAVTLRLNCFGGGNEDLETVNFQSHLIGFWDECEDESSCEIDFGQAEIELYKFCDCFPGGSNWQCDCEKVETTGFTATNKTLDNQVGNTCGAYLCDEIEMIVTGKIIALGGQQSYQVHNLFGGITYERIGGTNGVDIFKNITAQFIIQNSPDDITIDVTPSLPIQETTGGYDQDKPFSLHFSHDITLDIIKHRTVELVIIAQINEAAIEELGSQYVYPIRDFRGYLGTNNTPGQSDQKCTAPGTAQFFNLYRVLSGIGTRDGVASCNDGLINPPGIALGYCGGSYGDEFPGEDRPINRYINDMTISLEDVNGNLLTDLGIVQVLQNGVPILSFPPTNPITISDITEYLDPKFIDKDMFSNTNELAVKFTGDLACDIDEIIAHFEGTYEDNSFSNDPLCMEEIMFDELVPVPVLGGGINTFPLNPEITTACMNSEDTGTPLSIKVEAPGMEANFAVIYFDLTGIEGLIDIAPVTVTPPLFSNSGTTGSFQWFEFAVPIPESGMDVQFNYIIKKCEPMSFQLPYTVYKQCFELAVPPTVPFNDPEGCLSMNFFNIEVLPSDMIMTVHQCNELTDYCTPVFYSILIENPSQGAVQDVLFRFLAPDNMGLNNAWYRYDNNFPYANTFSCSTAGHTETDLSLSELEAGWLPGNILDQTNPTGGLPGFKMMAGDGFRQLHIILELEAYCDLLLESDELTFVTQATNNCGDAIETIVMDNTGHLSQEDSCNDNFCALCEAPENLDCYIADGAPLPLVLTWDPIMPTPIAYTVYISGDSPDCDCSSSIADISFQVFNGVHELHLGPDYLQNCFSWYVVPLCFKGVLSESSELMCYDPFGCHLPLREPGNQQRPQKFSSLKVFPNPSYGTLTIAYSMQEAAAIRVKVLNVEGKLIKEITELEGFSKDFRYTWNIDEKLTSGVYFIHLETDKEVAQQKFVLIR